jgi:GNAT superfamily N-acetyltransferase
MDRSECIPDNFSLLFRRLAKYKNPFMSLQIRPATEADVPLLLQLIGELAEFEKLSHEVKADTRTLRDSLFERRAAEALVAEADGTPVGFALFFHNFSTFLGKPGLYLEDLFIRPAYRGHGYGQELLRHLAGLAASRGCGRFEWAVLDWNVDAIRFYRRLGAEPMSDWTVFRLDEAGMRKLESGA